MAWTAEDICLWIMCRWLSGLRRWSVGFLIEGLLYKFFSEFGVVGRMWLAIKDPYTGVKARVLYSGSLFREFDGLQGTGQGRVLATFTYKVNINGLLNVLTNHCYSISVNRLNLPSPSFADDVTLLALYPTFLHTSMEMCYEYSIKWWYEFNHIEALSFLANVNLLIMRTWMSVNGYWTMNLLMNYTSTKTWVL